MDDKDWERKLERLPPDACALFAARAAMRALPLLAKRRAALDEAFKYWSVTEKPTYVMAVLRAVIFAGNDVVVASRGARVSFIRAAELAAAAAARAGAVTQVGAAARARTYGQYVYAYLVADAVTKATHAAYYATRAEAIGGCRVAAANAVTAAIASANSVLANFLNLLEVDYFILSKNMVLSDQPLFLNDSPPFKWQILWDQFSADVLALDPNFQIWLDAFTAHLEGKPLTRERLDMLLSVPDEIEAQGALAVNAYLAGLLLKTAVQPLNQVRAIFIGHGEAGKTSLVKVLHGESVNKGGTDMTPGIDISPWSVPDSHITAHFWDFGGQVMVHATHQFFLRSSCVYVLVISARNEISANEQAEYWLEHVKAFGGESAVLIVANRAEEAQLNLDVAALQRKYPNVKGHFPISCVQAQGAYRDHAQAFIAAFAAQLRALGTHQVMLSKEQFGVMELLKTRAAAQSFLSKADFEKICDSFDIGNEGVQNRTWLLDLLDKLGIVVHFSELPFADGYVLNPRWLTYGVYTLMYAKQARLHGADVIRILSLKKCDETGKELAYPPERCRLIIDAMKQFKLCYKVPGTQQEFLIPALLSPVAPAHGFDESGALEFEYVFDTFLPRHIVPELIVRRHHEIFKQSVWQTGAVFQHPNWQASALLRGDYQLRTVSLMITGKDARDYLALWRDEMEQVLGRLSIVPKEWVILPPSARVGEAQTRMGEAGRERANYRQLLTSYANNIPVLASDAGNVYDVAKVLGEFVRPERRDLDVQKQITVNIINSRVGGNITAADEIERSFNSTPTVAAAPAPGILQKMRQKLFGKDQ